MRKRPGETIDREAAVQDLVALKRIATYLRDELRRLGSPAFWHLAQVPPMIDDDLSRQANDKSPFKNGKLKRAHRLAGQPLSR